MCSKKINMDGLCIIYDFEPLFQRKYNFLDGSRSITPIYQYYAQEHLGNNRVVVNQNGTIEQITHYYAYGLPFSEGYDTSQQPYKYNGKELDRMHGLDWYDYGARFYDPALARFHCLDALAEKLPSWTPYNYVRNNPILRIDPNGKWDVTVHVYNNRKKHGYGVAIVTDRSGNEVY